MFEDKKWSAVLKEVVENFWRSVKPDNELTYIVTSNQLAALIELAMEEGRQEVQDDPSAFKVCDDCEDRRRAREPPP